MVLYIYKGTDLKGTRGEALVKRAWSLYTGKMDSPEIKRTAKGKPYFENSNISFSISHSGELWVCLFAHFNVGVDIQMIKDGHLQEIAARFFTKAEAETVRQEGRKAFYRIWTSREACGKYAGTGFFFQGEPDPYPFLREVFISSDYICTTAALKEEAIWINEIS